MKTGLPHLRRCIACALCLCMLTAAFAAYPAVHAAEDVSIQNGTGTREPIRVSGSYAYRAIVNGPFTGFGFTMPTWTKTNSASTLYLFKWEGTFDRTVAAEPLAKQTFDPMKDGDTNWVTFAQQPAGEYLFYVSDVRSEVGVWTNSEPVDSKGFLYLDGTESRGEPELRIRFVEKPAEPFGTCQSSAEVRKAASPYTSGTGDGVTNINESFGLRLNMNASFSGVQFKMATYYATDLEITVSVYPWKGSYAATIKSDPAASERIVMVDNAFQGISFDTLPAGDYLVMAHDPSGGPAMYHFSGVTGFVGYVYQDGHAVETSMAVFPQCKIIFSEERADNDYFLPCEAADDSVTGDHTPPPAYEIPADSLIYTHPVMPDTWVFTDGLGRTSLTNAEVGGPREDRTLAMFYWTWHIDGFVQEVPANLQELSEKYPEAMRDYDNPLWSQLGTGSYVWNQPIYGYYRSDDPWVLRRQAELLTNAGVDVIFTDNTNGTSTWRNAYTVLMDAWTEAMSDGLKTPKVSFMLPFAASDDSKAQLQSLYLDIYRQNKWQNLWFYWEGKPMLMAYSSNLSESASLTEREIINFFTFRANYPGYKNSKPAYGNWGWLSVYPQATYYASYDDRKEGKAEQITVGVSMNHDYEKGLLAAMSGNHIMGRSYTSAGYHTEAGAKLWGYNFAEQWAHALEVDPKVVFVTGWNEWRVGRCEAWPEGSAAAVENAFPDQFNDEYSRDIEPSKGDLKDHYYYQLVNFVRQYKGVNPIPTPSTSQTIDMSAGEAQWQTVEPYYAAYIGNTDDRNAQGYGDLVYTETSGRNDIIGAQIARDDGYVYFHVECAGDITPYTDPLWMTLYIDSDQQNQGWETFDYVINKSAASAGTVVLEKFTGEGYASVKVADCAYTVDGRYMTVKVAKSDLGLSGNDYTINFSWTDNVHDEGDYSIFSGDIMDFYISGDVAPGARFKYSYISTEANAAGGEKTDETDTETTPAESDTKAPETTVPAGDNTVVSTAPGTDTPAQSKGCSSVLTVAPVAGLTVMAAAAAAVRRRKKKE